MLTATEPDLGDDRLGRLIFYNRLQCMSISISEALFQDIRREGVAFTILVARGFC